MLDLLDACTLSAVTAASMVVVGTALSSWPQLAGEVILGATAVAEAVRRIGLAQQLRSGRIRIDVAAAFDSIAQPPPATDALTGPAHDGREHTAESGASADQSVVSAMAAAAVRAPSAGNAQPWHIEERLDAVAIRIAPEFSSTLDIDYRCSAVALGAAVFNARVPAAAHDALGPVELAEDDPRGPLHAIVMLGDAGKPNLAELYQPMLVRETNRRLQGWPTCWRPRPPPRVRACSC